PSLVLADEPTGALDSKAATMLLESLEDLNKNLNATIMMVTHDAFTASYANRILFIKDGKIFNELIKGTDSRKEFFNRIIEVITLLGGDSNNVF
ncbi:ABC transporter ATP-binding protein, partial [Clostridium perfringens]|nr:ABC transporter ATP-binding protein [Clostridium perfringens]